MTLTLFVSLLHFGLCPPLWTLTLFVSFHHTASFDLFVFLLFDVTVLTPSTDPGHDISNFDTIYGSLVCFRDTQESYFCPAVCCSHVHVSAVSLILCPPSVGILSSHCSLCSAVSLIPLFLDTAADFHLHTAGRCEQLSIRVSDVTIDVMLWCIVREAWIESLP